MEPKPEPEWLARQFEDHRAHLRAVAGRMLRSPAEAEDAVQEAWLRLSRADAASIENLRAWLTTVVSRVCLDQLRARSAHPEVEIPDLEDAPESSPEQQARLADSVGLALTVVLDALSPAERVAFVLHDLFDLSFDEIAPIVDRTPEAARQLASRARRRVRGAAASDSDLERRRELVRAFQLASRSGDLQALLRVLDANVVLRADAAAVAGSAANRAQGAPALEPVIAGAEAVAEIFRGRATGARAATLAGQPGLVWAPGGTIRAAFRFSFAAGRISGIEIVAEAGAIQALNAHLD